MLNDLGTNKQGLIVYDGESSADYGIVVSEAPSFDKPARKGTSASVPGRNGVVLFQQDAFEDVTRSYKVWLTNDAKNNTLVDSVRGLTEWLYSKKGYLRLEDSFEPDIYRLAYFTGGQNISNEMMQYGETTISFVCRPERFYKEGDEEIDITNADSLGNNTRFDAEPLIYIETSTTEEIQLTIGSRTIKVIVDDYIYIDCERMNAYRLPIENMNSAIEGDFPIIEPGMNSVSISGTVTKVTVIPRYFTI